MTPQVKLQLMASATVAATSTVAPADQFLHKFKELVVTWDITSAERDTGDETYDLYITTSDGAGSWDLIHFPQVTTTGAKTYLARIMAELLPQTVAANGTATAEGILLVSSTNAVATLPAGTVRHGKWGHMLGYKLVVAGTVATGIVCSVKVEAR